LFFRSIRLRLTLWYVITLAVILAASGLFWHISLSRNLLQHLDEKLLTIAEGIDAFYLSYGGLPGQDHCRDVEIFIRRHNWREFIQILHADGKILCVFGNSKEERLPLTAAGKMQASQGGHYFETDRNFGIQPTRILTYPIREDTRVVGLMQVGDSLADIEDTLRGLRLIILIFSPLALLIISFGGWFLAGKALSPVVRITRAANRINAENLSTRLPIEEPRDELAELAATFNSMLSRLEGSFRKVKQFSGDASHELRTPLAILRGETEVTLRWARSSDEYRRTLESNLEEIDRMGRIIDDLLTLAKSDAREMPLEIKEISLSDLLQDLYLAGKTLGESKNIEILLHLDVAEEIRIQGDELRLRQIFLNLISNGIKYTPAGGRVEIFLAVEPGHAVVTISDTGIGIPREHLPHIFDRFYRIDKARNRADGGTGLGLAITKSIVEAHAGWIQVTSDPGKGSSFTVYLPLGGPASPGWEDRIENISQ
jgi:heavy metal sensor kinase